MERKLEEDNSFIPNSNSAHQPDDLAALLNFESEKAAERGMSYVVRTVHAALQHY
jgi:hypothetical protein